jgi:hypothetical protein
MSTELTNFSLSQPAQAMEVAGILQRFVTEKKLTANIKGKNYPLVEAWQFAGSQLGLYPLLTSVIKESTSEEIKYAAWVDICRMDNNQVMSRGFATCSNKESSKRQFDEYAICSMAQTRAEGKAYRMLLSWLMKAAGFEATPAEEMDFARGNNEIVDVPEECERKLLRDLVYSSDLRIDEIELALAAIESCPNYDKYDKIRMRLESRQKTIDTIINHSQKDINNHLKKVIK